MYKCKGSLLEGLEKQDVSVKFRLAMAASISYVLFVRCSFQPEQYLKSKNFKDIPYPAQPKGNDRDRQPLKDFVKKPDGSTEKTVQENDTKEPEHVSAEATDSENAEQPTPDTEPTVFTETEATQEKSDLREMPALCNFIITDERLGEDGPKAKFGRNMEAITVLKKVESENRPATPDEQQVLSKYVGWGGIPDAFEPGKAGWALHPAKSWSLLDTFFALCRIIVNWLFVVAVITAKVITAHENGGDPCTDSSAVSGIRVHPTVFLHGINEVIFFPPFITAPQRHKS